MLPCGVTDRIAQPGITDDAIGRDGEPAGRRFKAGAPIAEAVAIGLDRHARVGQQEIRALEIAGARRAR